MGANSLPIVLQSERHQRLAKNPQTSKCSYRASGLVQRLLCTVLSYVQDTDAVRLQAS